MLDWLRRIFGLSPIDERQQFFTTIDALNSEILGGEPVVLRKSLGQLSVPSGTLVLGDPGIFYELEIPNVAVERVDISASLWCYPSGIERVIALSLGLGETSGPLQPRIIGEVRIGSARLLVADKADIEEYWTDTGRDRIGVISTAPDDTVLRLLTTRFKLKTIRVNHVRAEVVGPVSETLAEEIEAFLRKNPKYGDFHWMYFRVETYNSFERAIDLKGPWDFLPIGHDPEPLMFVSETGRGDGNYDVHGRFEGDIPRILTIAFVEEESAESGTPHVSDR